MELQMLSARTDILIVGAGPTGLVLAAALQKAGVDHLLIDAGEARQSTSRAAVVHAHTLEALEAIDVVEPLAAQAIELCRFAVRDRDQALLQVGFDRLPSTYRHLLMVPQSTTETVLERRLMELGGEVHRGVSATTVARDAGGAAVQVATANGARTIQARYVVGADGMHSVVREAAGIGFPGDTHGESFVLADVRMEWPLGVEEVSLFFSPAGLVVVAPLPDGSFRVVATMHDAPEHIGRDDIQRLLDARGPAKQACRVREVAWSSRFRVHHRLANSYRSGPFLLIGDAAHVHSPAGGQGMNTGIVDAIVLSRALVGVVRDGAPDGLLDAYSASRRPAAQEVLTLAARLTHIAVLKSAMGRKLRNVALRLLDRLPPFKRQLTMALSGLGRRRFSALPGAAETGDLRAAPRPRRAILRRPAVS
jgi:2-polyprenyl-6-methoxyphenol hydroxylase-like FAD-dependent oxidoreductase